MSDDSRVGVSRRKLLSGVALAGSAGALTGVGAGALVVDDDTFFDNLLRSGRLDLAVEWTDATGGTTVSNGGVDLDVGPLTAGDAGHSEITVDLPQDGGEDNNPAHLWLRTNCPSSTGDVAEALTVGLWYAHPDGSRLENGLVVAGSLCEVGNDLRNGIPVDGDPTTPERDCLDATDGSPLRLRFEWSLDEAYEGTGTASVGLELFASQCRHDDGTASPFPAVPTCDCGGDGADRHGVSFVEIWTCDAPEPDCECSVLGKLELDDGYCGESGVGDNHVEVGVHDLYVDDDCEDTGVDVNVTATEEKEGGETVGLAFELLDGDGNPGPDVCRVVVKGGPGTVTYDADDLGPRSNDTGGLLYAPEKP